MNQRPDMHEHQRLTTHQYRRMHGYLSPLANSQFNSDRYHNGEVHQHDEFTSYKTYGPPLSNADWSIPVRLVAEERNGKIVKLTILPMEGDAGYFGPESQVIDGTTSYEDLPEMWDALGEYLAENQVWGSDDRHFLHWEG